MKEAARFFCENCNAEVKANARFCGKCGKFFVSVRCPSCGKTGPQAMFAAGCPNCGYAGAKSGSGEANKPQTDNSGRRLFRGGKAGASRGRKQMQRRSSGDLPYWVYGMLAAIFSAVIFLLFKIYAE
ncbi:MAG: zinc ribbon domain-containing protein [Bacteroides sp.]|nr:zinc ribbon domain-containing protein [Prevotella sp.]MCM1407276.1 zinc ribbon domain-containing protein [Treponema brennaborense]MCM1469764.1 zinc ribbon domain-containing protein [Bacteroides sp.]